MTKLQLHIVSILAIVALLVNLVAFGVTWWCERDLEQRGISIEEILSK